MGPTNLLFSILCYFPQFQTQIKMFTSKKNTNNQWLLMVYGLNTELIKMLKYHTYSNQLSLIDIIGVDLSKLTNFSLFFNNDVTNCPTHFFNKLINYNLIDYKNTARYSFLYLIDHNVLVNSLGTIFFNSVWLERELVEFFNFNLQYQSDTRNLLLDYNFTSNPLLKNFPTEGYQEIFFNHLSYTLEYTNNEFIEL